MLVIHLFLPRLQLPKAQLTFARPVLRLVFGRRTGPSLHLQSGPQFVVIEIIQIVQIIVTYAFFLWVAAIVDRIAVVEAALGHHGGCVLLPPYALV